MERRRANENRCDVATMVLPLMGYSNQKGRDAPGWVRPAPGLGDPRSDPAPYRRSGRGPGDGVSGGSGDGPAQARG